MKISRILSTVFSAVLFTLAIPNELFHYGNPLLGLFAIAPFFYSLAKCITRKEAARLGAVFAVVNSFLTYFWLLFFLDFSVWTITGVTLAHAIYFWVLSQVIHRVSQSPPLYRPFLISLVWIVYEYIKSIGFLGFPWGLIAYTVNMIQPFIQTADLFGIWATGFIMVLINSLLAELLLLRDRSFILGTPGNYNPALLLPSAGIKAGSIRKFKVVPLLASFSFWAVLVLLSLGYGLFRMNQPIPSQKTVRLVLIQQNTDSWENGMEMESLLVSQQLTREALKASDKPVDLVVWSENTFRMPYLDTKKRYLTYPKGDPFLPFLKEINTPLLTGSPIFVDYDHREAMNAVILLNPDGFSLGYYGKQHLVPVAERIPFYTGLVEKFFSDVIGLETAGWTPGSEYKIFSLALKEGGSLSFGTPICFEDSFAYLGRNFYNSGAEILINLTNDSWSKTVSAQTQHFVTARFRSIENRRVLVRSSNSGVSTVVDPWGRMVYTLPMFEKAYLIADIPVYKEAERTLYAVLGDLLPQLFILLVLIYLVYSETNKKRGF